MALNTSAIYLGQAAGAVERRLADRATAATRRCSWVGLAWLVAAIALSVWAARAVGAAPRA